MKEKYSAVLLALIGGGIGLHKFYLGKTTSGILYAVFCWTLVPSILATIDAIYYLFMDKDEFEKSYNKQSDGTAENCEAMPRSAEDAETSLQRAKQLFDNGALSEEEYNTLKGKILEGTYERFIKG